MGFILLLEKNWRLLVGMALMALSFAYGWYIRGMADEIKEQRAVRKQIIIANSAAVGYERELQLINIEAEKLNHKLKGLYENSGYRCPVPGAGMRILSEAIH